MDRWQALRAFVAVVDHGGFSAAARALDMSSPSITRLVAELEGQLGVRLLQRTTRRVTLTDEGAVYVERVRRVLGDLEDADALVSQRSQRVSGVLRVLATPVLANVLVAPVVARLLDQHDGLRVDLDVQSYTVPSVEAHDVALFAIEGELPDSNLVVRRMASGHSMLFAAPAYLQQAGVPDAPDDLAHHRLLRYRTRDSHGTSWLLTHLQEGRSVVISVPPRVESRHVETLLRVALSGGGIVALAPNLVRDAVQRAQLQPVLPAWAAEPWTLYAALPTRRHLPARTRVFLEALAAGVRAALDNPMEPA
ncbi:LysR family transcriptional regulator [Tepidimonas ignava]|jgi:DNA-binding transcriptional LysR family regulator|uniref:LysR family transcriptional regulator n=1 Tax=Tepidimonas ignava TaxID=114249 RepID=UPI002FD8CC46